MLLVFGVVLAGWLGLYLMKPKASMCPACGCMTLMPNRGGTRWQCENCGELFHLLAGAFVGRRGIERGLPAAKLRVEGDSDKVER